jgi:hypothetical protein
VWLAADVDLSDINCLVNPRWRAIKSIRSAGAAVSQEQNRLAGKSELLN